MPGSKWVLLVVCVNQTAPGWNFFAGARLLHTESAWITSQWFFLFSKIDEMKYIIRAQFLKPTFPDVHRVMVLTMLGIHPNFSLRGLKGAIFNHTDIRLNFFGKICLFSDWRPFLKPKGEFMAIVDFLKVCQWSRNSCLKSFESPWRRENSSVTAKTRCSESFCCNKAWIPPPLLFVSTFHLSPLLFVAAFFVSWGRKLDTVT